MPLAPPPPHALPPPGPYLAPHRMPLLSTRQAASAFNQPLSLDTSKVTTMQSMFRVRSARALRPPSLESGLPSACTPSRLPARTSSRPPFDSRQSANSLSAANKLLIRCTWTGTSAFVSAGYGSDWGSGTCPM